MKLAIRFFALAVVLGRRRRRNRLFVFRAQQQPGCFGIDARPLLWSRSTHLPAEADPAKVSNHGRVTAVR